MKRCLLSLAITLVGLPGSTALAQLAGSSFTFQGQLKRDGVPVDDSCAFEFSLWNDPTGTDPSQRIAGPLVFDGLGGNLGPVAVKKGLFSVELDFGAGAFDGQDRWLEVSATCPAGTGSSATLTPRQPLTATPYALQTRGVFVDDAGKLGIGTTSPQVPLHIAQNTGDGLPPSLIAGTLLLAQQNSGNNWAHMSILAGRTGRAQLNLGDADNDDQGALSYNNHADAMDFRVNDATRMRINRFGRVGIGTLFPTTALNVVGGEIRASRSDALWKQSISMSSGTPAGSILAAHSLISDKKPMSISSLYEDDGGQPAGSGDILFQTGEASSPHEVMRISESGRVGIGTPSPATSLHLGLPSNARDGIFLGKAGTSHGTRLSVTGTNNQIFSIDIDPNGISGYEQFQVTYNGGSPVFLIDRDGHLGPLLVRQDQSVSDTALNADGRIAVFGSSDSSSGVAIWGHADASTGVNYGVLGRTESPAGYGVYSEGDMGATGTKSFCIDHPDDPENKYLLHYAAESPEVINFYRGTVTLDGSGEAIAELPPYFGKINNNPSYQLTAIGAPMPNLHVAKEIDEAALRNGAAAGPNTAAPPCRFHIAGGVPGGKVSWRVEAVRNDLWVRNHKCVAEKQKHGPERGKFQHPELYGQPPEMAVHYRPPLTTKVAETRDP